MANSNDALLATRLNDWIVESAGLYKNEFRKGMYGALNFFLNQLGAPDSVVSDEARAAAHNSNGRTIKIPVLKASNATIGTTRSCDIPNNEVKSAMQTVTFSSLVDGFYMFPQRYTNNVIGYRQHFAANMQAMLLRFWKKLDELCIANLEANKNTVWTDVNLMNATQSGNVIQFSHRDRFDMMGDLSGIMHSAGWGGTMNLIGNSGIANVFLKLYEYGKFNETDLTYEYSDKRFWETSNLQNGSGKYATTYIVPNGQVGMLSRVSRAEFANARGPVSEWGTTLLPGCGDLLFGTHFKKIEGNMAAIMNGSGTFSNVESSVNDMDCDMAECYGFAIDIAFVNAYNSQSGSVAEPVMKAEVARGTNAVDVNVLNNE